MRFNPSAKVWLALGASLAVSGGFAIVISIQQGGLVLWTGVGLVAAGSIALRMGLSRSDPGVGGPAAGLSGAHTRAAVEPELRRPAPRKVRMTARGKTVVASWMLAVAAFAGFANEHYSRLQAPQSRAVLDREGSTSTATVHSLEARDLEDGRTLYFVGYSFLTRSGSPVRISRSVSASVHGRLSEGERTRVVYMPGNPDSHYLPEITSPVSTRLVFFIGGLLLAAAGFAEAQRRLHRRLVSKGTAVAGYTAEVRRRGGVRSFLVNYEVAGERRSLRARERNRDLRSGQPATVLYDPSTSGRAVVYRLALYRAQA